MLSSQSGQAAQLTVNHLKMHFPIYRGFVRRVVGHVKAVDDVSLSVCCGETLGLVGESGCGKTTVGRCIVRAYEPTGGEILYQNERGESVDLATLPKAELKPYRREMRMIFQDPYASLNPRMNVLDIVGRAAQDSRHRPGQGTGRSRGGLAQARGLAPEYMRRYPHAFSGGPAAAHRHRARAGARAACWSSPTSRSRRWTFRCRRRSST